MLECGEVFRAAGLVGSEQAAAKAAAASSATLRATTRRSEARRVVVAGMGTSSGIGASMSVTSKLRQNDVNKQAVFGTAMGLIGRDMGEIAYKTTACYC
jgi:D-arabinose 5-phosphate isomerase GutQ